MPPEVFFIGIVIVILSIIFHEVAHGYVANALGDPTARLSGRLTLNPIPHIDPIGSVLVPGILALSGTPFLVGWAKPVPYNPYNLNNQRWGEAMVAAAGPLTNIIIAVVAGLGIRFFGDMLSPAAFQIAALVIFANLVLAIINLIPLPPLDGSKILRSILPAGAALAYGRLENMTYALGPFGLLGVLFILVFIFSDAVFAFIRVLFTLITGVMV